MWICNFDLKETKQWNKNDPLPDGWVKGRHSKEAFEHMELMQ